MPDTFRLNVPAVPSPDRRVVMRYVFVATLTMAMLRAAAPGWLIVSRGLAPSDSAEIAVTVMFWPRVRVVGLALILKAATVSTVLLVVESVPWLAVRTA